MKISNINSNIFHRGRRNLKSDSWQLTVIAYENAKSITLNLFSLQELGIGTVALFFWQQRRKRKKMQLKVIIPKLQKNYTHIQNMLRLMLGPTIWDTTEKLFFFGGNLRILPFCQIHNIRYCRISFNGNLRILSFCHQHIHVVSRFVLLNDNNDNFISFHILCLLVKNHLLEQLFVTENTYFCKL